MNDAQRSAATTALVAARRQHARPDALPDGAHPQNLEEAHQVQDAVIAALGERVAGWKVAINAGGVMRGAVLASRALQNPARYPAGGLPLLGIEGEIAFLFENGLPPRETEYDAAEVAAAAIALVGIEIVGTRFRDYDHAPLLDRTADCMSNEAFVLGTRRADWREHDLSALEAVLTVNGTETVRQIGGHASKDPLIPAIALVNTLRRTVGIAAGQFITTGTFTGLYRAKPGDRIAVTFTGFGEAAITLTA